MRHMTIYGSKVPSWYDIKGFSIDHLEDEEGIKESAKKSKNSRALQLLLDY